jgi:putative PIN family toxin of toxin-antitoxin system
VRRAVLDPGVFVSALITPNGTAAKLLAAASGGELELIVSPLLLAELEEVLRRKKFRRYFGLDVVGDYLDMLRRLAVLADDPDEPPPLRSRTRRRLSDRVGSWPPRGPGLRRLGSPGHSRWGADLHSGRPLAGCPLIAASPAVRRPGQGPKRYRLRI